MQVPIGVSGVQAVPNTLHSHGFSTPLSTSPHWHAFGSATRTPGTENNDSASMEAKDDRTRSADCAMNPRAGMHLVHTVIQHDFDTELLRKLTGVAYGAPITLADGGGPADSRVVLASGDAFITDAGTRDPLAQRADLVDMEGYAFAAAAADAGLPVSLVKHVTDEADKNAVRSWRDSVAVSARDLAAWAAANVPGY